MSKLLIIYYRDNSKPTYFIIIYLNIVLEFVTYQINLYFFLFNRFKIDFYRFVLEL